ncbi:MAG: hypothetical protein U1F48_20505 [Burkholderiales bacterium]
MTRIVTSEGVQRRVESTDSRVVRAAFAGSVPAAADAAAVVAAAEAVAADRSAEQPAGAADVVVTS